MEQRILKFRAWDQEDDRMIVEEQDFIPLLITHRGVLKLDPCLKETRYYIVPTIDKRGEQFIFMQYTGRNIHKAELWESDIVRTGSGIGKIIYFDTYARFMVEFEDGTLEGLERVVRKLGNIYEHSHLLKGSPVWKQKPKH